MLRNQKLKLSNCWTLGVSLSQNILVTKTSLQDKNSDYEKCAEARATMPGIKCSTLNNIGWLPAVTDKKVQRVRLFPTWLPLPPNFSDMLLLYEGV